MGDIAKAGVSNIVGSRFVGLLTGRLWLACGSGLDGYPGRDRSLRAFLIFIFVIGIIYRVKFSVDFPFATKPHETLGTVVILIPNLTHDVQFPVFSLELSQFSINSYWWRFQENLILNRRCARFSNMQDLLSQQQISAVVDVVGGMRRQSMFTTEYSISSLHYCRARASYIHDDKSTRDFRSMAEKKSRLPDMRTVKNGYVPHTQPRTMRREKLQATDSLLLCQNICLVGFDG